MSPSLSDYCVLYKEPAHLQYRYECLSVTCHVARHNELLVGGSMEIESSRQRVAELTVQTVEEG